MFGSRVSGFKLKCSVFVFGLLNKYRVGGLEGCTGFWACFFPGLRQEKFQSGLS